MVRGAGVPVALAATVAALAFAPAAGADFVVNTATDANDTSSSDPDCDTGPVEVGPPNTCSLRAAITQANFNGDATTTITFDGDVGPLFSLTQGDLDPNPQGGDELTIQGIPGGGTTIDANGSFGVINIGSTASKVTLNDLTITDGFSNNPVAAVGLGISSGADLLVLNRVAVTGNRYIGDGSVAGVGIFTATEDDDLVLIDSTVSGNLAVNLAFNDGVGIQARGVVRIIRSSIVNNIASGAEGTGAGGGLLIANSGQVAEIVNSTISNNASGSGGGGGIAFKATPLVQILNSTIAGNSSGGNGGGVAGAATLVAVKNSIFAENIAVGTGPNCSWTPPAAPVSNIDGGTSCGFGTTNGNLQNVTPGQLLLGPLAGDGVTQTRALGYGSVALSAGDPATCADPLGVNAEDQRGEPRPQGPGCDIGAWEGDPADDVAPNTRITKRPKKRTPKRRARFRFSSTEAGSQFRCKLDRKPYAACTSPKVFRVKVGRHRVRIQAIDAAGNPDGSPASFRWRRIR